MFLTLAVGAIASSSSLLHPTMLLPPTAAAVVQYLKLLYWALKALRTSENDCFNGKKTCSALAMCSEGYTARFLQPKRDCISNILCQVSHKGIFSIRSLEMWPPLQIAHVFVSEKRSHEIAAIVPDTALRKY